MYDNKLINYTYTLVLTTVNPVIFTIFSLFFFSANQLHREFTNPQKISVCMINWQRHIRKPFAGNA